jgi:hypothetical protein
MAPDNDKHGTVTRIGLVDPHDPDTDPEVQRLLREQLQASGRGQGGHLHNVILAMANNVEALELVGAITRVSRSGRLTPAQRELAYLTASVVNNCHY